MAKSNLLNTRTTNFLELLSNGRVYRVPAYQRDYSWEEPEWEDLWNDIDDLRLRPDDRHYMGALVVQATSDREFAIIDGQQQLATLSILALAVIAKLNRVAADGAAPEDNRERAAALRSRFIGEKDPASLVESSKLFLNATDDAFYQDYLVQLRSPLNPRGLAKSNRLLWMCFRYFASKLDGTAAFALDGLFETMRSIAAENAQREYYLPDLVAIYRRRGRGVATVTVANPDEILGINSRVELAAVSRIVRQTKNAELMASGVTIEDPATTYVDGDVMIGADTIIHPAVSIEGRTTIGVGCVIHSGVRIVDSRIGDRVTVHNHSIV